MSLPSYSALYAFGDSLSDAGDLSITTGAVGATEPVSPPYFQQIYRGGTGNVFSNGPTWAQNLSIALGLGTLSPSLLGGNDFAVGGAETGSTPQDATEPTIQAISLPTQLTEFQAEVPKPAANALYTLSIGSNDVLDILSNTSLSAAQQTTDINDAVANEVSFIQGLIKDGAQTILVLNVPDLGLTPDSTSGAINGSNTPSASLNAEASSLALQYDNTLASSVAGITGASVRIINAYQLLDNAVANPAAYGLTNVTTPVWSGNFTSASSGTLAAVGAAAQDTSLFWDHLHPTEAGHQAIADLAEQTLSGTPVLTVLNTTTGQTLDANGSVYTGPVIGPLQDYVNITSDSLNITATTPNWFLEAGSGTNALAVSGGDNVLDAAGGSTFFTDGSGTDIDYIDDRTATANTWSTIANLHAGDSVTLWGVSASDFALSWLQGQGAAGFTGLTLVASEAGSPTTALTLAGYSSANLGSGALSVAFGNDTAAGNLPYMTITARANA